MSKKLLIVCVMLAALAVLVVGPVPAQDKVTINWFVGLGTGYRPEQQEVQNQKIAEFNESQDQIELVVQYVDNTISSDTLSTLIAAGDGPDIVGPVGFDGSNAFGDNWLDLQPLVDSTGLDLSQWPEALVDFYRTPDGLLGLPLATFPSFLYYRPGLFDEAGLNYPPAAYGEKYVMADGSEVDWDVNTLRDVAMLLTVDANGNDATSPDFDAEDVVQWGFNYQWYGPDPRQLGSMFGAARLWDPETGNAQIPEQWDAAWKWWYNGLWTDHFIPTAAQESSDLLAAGNPFESGNMAMSRSHLWYTCCVTGEDWNTAALPSYNGVVTAQLHADTFRVYKGTEHPDEAFEVLNYLVGDASLALLSQYGGMPSRVEDQEAFFAELDAKYPQGVNWDVVKDSQNYADVPSHEANMPNYIKAKNRGTTFATLLANTPDLDLDAEIATYLADLQAIFDEVK